MVFKVGKTKKKSLVAGQGRVPLNYYRSGPPEAKASPFVRKIAKTGRARKYFMRTLDLVVLIVILFVLVYSLLVKPTPLVLVNDTTYHSSAEYKSAAAQQLGAFKNRNKISFDEQGIVTSLQKQFPEISSASIELPLFSETATVRLNVAKPSFFFSSKGVDYIIDAQGVATAVAKNLPQIKNLTTLTDQSGFNTQRGEQVLSAQDVSFIDDLLAQTTHDKVPVNSLILPAQAQELDLKTADRGYYVKFYMGGDPLLQAGQFLATRHNFDQTGKQPAQYLDVRVPGKIFYK